MDNDNDKVLEIVFVSMSVLSLESLIKISSTLQFGKVPSVREELLPVMKEKIRNLFRSHPDQIRCAGLLFFQYERVELEASGWTEKN